MKKEYDLQLPLEKAKRPILPEKLLLAENILRLNPHWIVEKFSGDSNQFQADLKDHATGSSFQLSGSLSSASKARLTITLSHKDYKSIELYQDKGSIWGTVVYNCETDTVDEEIEKHVVLWLRSIKEYLRMYLKDSLNAKFFRYIMNKIILQMTPSQRKISLMLIRITVVEILVILFIVVGYVIFVLK